MTPTSLADFEQAIAAHLGRRDLTGARAVAAQCRLAWPDARPGWLLGSIAALLADDPGEALALIDTRLSRAGTDLESLLQRAECLLALGRRADALQAADDAVRSAAGNPGALDAVGQFQVHAHAHAEARATYEAALSLAPGDRLLLGKHAMVCRFVGDFAAAAQDYEGILTQAPDEPDALKEYAELRHQTGDSPLIVRMQAALARVPPTSKAASTLHFGLAKCYDDTDDAPNAWRHWEAGNRLERTAQRYDAAIDRGLTDALIRHFTRTLPNVASTCAEQPIFIVGLPRSGTTLVERILGSHSGVHPAGELPALSEALAAQVRDRYPRGYSWSEFVATLPGVDAGRLAADYLARVRARRGELPRFTDKQPTNFFYCPLIVRAFPRATLVHVTRHPIAACFAIYRMRFQGTYPFAYSLEDIAAFYIGYRRLMAHWQQLLPGAIIEIAYEDLVRSPETATRALLARAGLQFEAGCLEFDRNPTPTTTASAVQVRQRIHDRSLDRWRHYARELAPLQTLLENAGIDTR